MKILLLLIRYQFFLAYEKNTHILRKGILIYGAGLTSNGALYII